MLGTAESHFHDHPMMVCIISGMVVRVRVCVADVPLAMSRYFGHDGGHSIDFLLVLLALGSVSCYVHK